MKIINLIENTEGRRGCACDHGLSFYVETEKHRLLLDLGPSGDTIENAEKMGVDLKSVDTVVLSHGHYDHSGGIMPFAEINDQAVIYMQEKAADDYFADERDDENGRKRYRYIGIDKNIAGLPQVVFLEGDCGIDDEIEIYTIKNRSHAVPFANKKLMIRSRDRFERDDFTHEQYLVVRQCGKTILLSGCAHNGILSILDAFCEKYGEAPDLVISGFHLMKNAQYNEDEILEIEDIAKKLASYPTRFVTCHCTSVPAFDMMKRIMGEKLEYVHCGEEIRL